MIQSHVKLRRAFAAIGISLIVAPSVSGQIATLDKGHQLLENSGLQIWGLNTDSFQYSFNYNNLTAANMNAVMWSHGQSNPGVLSAGQKWGKWVDHLGNPATALNATETAHYADLLAIQVGDEQQTDLESPNGATKAWFNAAHAGNYFTDKLMYVNSTYVNDVNAYINFVATANPDALSWDAYPFGTTGVYPYNWLGKAQIFRRVALGSYIGAHGAPARPYGLYLQTYHGGDGARDPGDVEMRWQMFTAWTLGYTFVDAFTAGGGNTSLFNSGDGNSPHQPTYDQFKESARQSRNLGPALTKLISYGYGPNIVLGKDASGTTNLVPIDWPLFNKANAPPNQQYLGSVVAQNPGTKNGGQPGDVYVGFFNPLLASYGDPAGTAYFMVTNALGAYLQDATLTPADCAQQITLDFDFGSSTVNSLQRLRRSDGQVEVVPLSYISGNKYRLLFDLEGGTGDLFKYNDGTPFVGVQNTTLHYWDNDATAANNNTSTGAGLGGNGTWNTSANKWFNGSTDVAWAGNYNAVFAGTAGTVTLSAPQSVNSLLFKTNGYSINGSTLTMNGSYLTTDAGVIAAINSNIAGTGGLIKSGPGTLTLSATNSYSGGTTIIGGAIIGSTDANLGAVPSTFTPGNIVLNGGTFRFAANVDIHNNRGITLGPGGGTIDTQTFSNPAGYNASAGGFRGPGDLTKTGSGIFFAASTGGGLNTTWTGRLIIKEGTWKIVATDGLPYNAPSGDGLQPGQVTLDGGTWQIGANISATNARRGVTIAAGGGTVDTQNFNLTWAGPWAGASTSAVLNKIGTGLLRLNSTALAPGSYAGTLNVNAGTLQLDGGTAMGDLAAVSLASNTTASITPTAGTPVHEVIGSLAGMATASLSLNVNSLTTGGNNNSTTYAGSIGGSGSLTKTGAGIFTLTGNNGYSGMTTVDAGSLVVNGSIPGAVLVKNSATLAGSGSIGGTVTVQAGGTLMPGNSPGTITVGSLNVANLAFLPIEIGPVSDKIVSTGDIALGGSLAVSLVPGYTPDLGQTFTIMTANNITGGFGATAVPIFSHRRFDVTVNPQSVVLTVVPSLSGDFNADGSVDAADYVVWRKGLGTTYTAADYDKWQANFGLSDEGSGSTAAVPEPGVLVLLGGGWVSTLLMARVHLAKRLLRIEIAGR